ncbi:MAG: cryptochrome/photolyase family protein [Bacteriovoracaceae bacterium]
MKYGIHWFRRDLRICANPALQKNWQKNEGKVIGLFCFDEKFLSRDDFSANRFQFFLNTLGELRRELRLLGSDLLLLPKSPDSAFESLFKDLKNHDKPFPNTISWNRDYEPFARERDKRIDALLKGHQIETLTSRDHLIIEPHELTKKDSSETYKVYTPFSRRWMELFQINKLSQNRIPPKQSLLRYIENIQSPKPKQFFSLKFQDIFSQNLCDLDAFENYEEKNKKHVTIEIPPAGHSAAINRVLQFKKNVDAYENMRDTPSIDGTSQIAHFLKNGSLSTCEVLSLLELHKDFHGLPSSRHKYLKEIIWREFYYHILYHHPRVEKEAFNIKYKDVPWDNNPDFFQKWKDGCTGFPIIDAGMRQLKETGWMHNRVRMIVASFLVKDLNIDWRLGEEYFMRQLLDGDLAPNNGGWQWAASTGCDAQPYFRIFNPWSQSKKFDPDGIYIKRFIPELKDLPAKQLHAPILDHKNYPAPIVDHSERRIRTLEIFKSL